MNGFSEKIALSVPEAAKMLGVTKVKVYELCGRQDFPAVHIGRRIIIPVQGLHDWLTEQSGRPAV